MLLSYTWRIDRPLIYSSYNDVIRNKGRIMIHQVPDAGDDRLGEKKSKLGKESLLHDVELPEALNSFAIHEREAHVIFGVSDQTKCLIDFNSKEVKKFGQLGPSKGEIEVVYNGRNHVLFWSSDGKVQWFDLRMETNVFEQRSFKGGIKAVEFNPCQSEEYVVLQENKVVWCTLGQVAKELPFVKLVNQQSTP